MKLLLQQHLDNIVAKYENIDFKNLKINEDWIKWPDIAQKNTPIIDEMIEYFDNQLFHVKAWRDQDDDWEDEVRKLNKFITYLEELKHKIISD